MTSGWLTEAARTYAAALPGITVWNGDDLAVMSMGEAATGGAPVCPACGAAMVERRARRTGERFLGCVRFPACRKTRPAPA